MTSWRGELAMRLERLELRPEREAEIIEELAQHLDDYVRDLVAGGVAHDEAQRAALEHLDAPGILALQLSSIESRRPSPLPPPGAPRRGSWLAAPWHDARQAIRSLRRMPGFTATVVVAMALAIAPTTAILSVGNWLLWRPAPVVRDPNRVAEIWTGSWKGPRSVSPRDLSYLNLQDLQRSVRLLTGLAGMQEGGASVAVEGLPPQGGSVASVTANYFDTLNVRIVAGRVFRANEDQPPFGAHVAVVSDGLARRAFGSSAAAIGRRVALNGLPLSIVGVVEPGFVGISPTSRVEVWYPGATYAYVNRFPDDFARRYANRSHGIFYAFIGRLAPGATFDQAQAELDRVLPQIVERYPAENEGLRGVEARVFPGLGVQPPFGRERQQTLVNGLLIIGLLLLVLGCANVANLLLVGGIRRQRDRAVRLALGASRARLLQLQLIESCLLAVGGAAAGVLLAFWLKQFIHSLIFPAVAIGTTRPDVPLDGRVLGVTLAAAVICGLVAGLAPAWIGSSPRLMRVLGQADFRSTRRGARLRTALATAQLALSLTLTTGALFMTETLAELRRIDLGFDPNGVSAHYLGLEEHGYTRERARDYYAALLSRLGAVPGVTAASLSELVPFGSGNIVRLRVAGVAEADQLRANANGVDERYFGLLRIAVVRGRGFTADDVRQWERSEELADGTPVVLGESLARRLFGEQDPIGRRVEDASSAVLAVIGVARDVHWNSLVEAPELFVYLPFGSRDYRDLDPVLMVRSTRSPDEVAGEVQAVMRALDPTMPVRFSRALTASVNQDGDLANRIVFAWALSMLGALGFALALFGLVGLLAATVWERTREFGVRVAIGAARAHLFGLVLRQAAWIAAGGTVIGLILAWFGSRLLEAQLYGVTRFDAGVYVTAAAALVVVVFAAAAWPGYRATRVNPVDALRAE